MAQICVIVWPMLSFMKLLPSLFTPHHRDFGPEVVEPVSAAAGTLLRHVSTAAARG
jgi:hypothetical protein